MDTFEAQAPTPDQVVQSKARLLVLLGADPYGLSHATPGVLTEPPSFNPSTLTPVEPTPEEES